MTTTQTSSESEAKTKRPWIAEDRAVIEGMWKEMRSVQGDLLQYVTWPRTEHAKQMFEVLYRLAHSYIWTLGPHAQLKVWPVLAGCSCENLSKFYEEYSNQTGKWVRILTALRFIPEFQRRVGERHSGDTASWKRIIEILDIKFHAFFHGLSIDKPDRTYVSEPRGRPRAQVKVLKDIVHLTKEVLAIEPAKKELSATNPAKTEKKAPAKVATDNDRPEVPDPEYISLEDFVSTALMWTEL